MAWFATARAELGDAPVALATVVATRGSTPRHAGADGDRRRRAGAGAPSAVVASRPRWWPPGARSPAAVRAPGDPPLWCADLAMCCGGWMDVLVAPLAGDAEVRAEVAAAAAARAPLEVRTPLAGGPLSTRRLVDAAPAQAPRVIDDALVEVVAPPDRAVIFGGGHVGRAIGPIAASCGWQVVVCDDGDTGALDELGAPAWASAVVDSFEVGAIERVIGPLGAGDYVLIVTRDHAVDQRVLEQLVGRTGLTYLGMIGSRGKVGRFRKRLAAKGLLAEDAPTALRAPVGLDVGAETPAEIAVAIVAELIAVRRRGTPGAGDWRPRPHEHLPASELVDG
ncbi:MAG: XdhC family protein [Kofleriaceae bacterium]